MKQVVLQAAVTLSVTILLACVPASNVYADTYLRSANGNSWEWPEFNSFDHDGLDQTFWDINQTLRDAMRWEEYDDKNYLHLYGTTKRHGVFKLQKTSNVGSRVDLVLPSKIAAEEFCYNLTDVAHGIRTAHTESDVHTVFVSQWHGTFNEVVAVAYLTTQSNKLIARTGIWNTNIDNKKLTSGKKYWLCSNPWHWKLSNDVADENETSGIKASGMGRAYEYSRKSGDLYHVICNNPAIPENEFIWDDYSFAWRDSFIAYEMPADSTPTLDEMNATVGDNYCAGKLKPQ